MPSRPKIRRKWTFRAHNQQAVFVKGQQERPEHVFMKAFLWALYLPQYPQMRIEVYIGDRYKPDLVQLDAAAHPLFWGEAGQVGKKKIHKLVRRYRDTHFVIAKWNLRLAPLEALVTEALDGVARTAPFELISIPEGSAERLIDETGQITITPSDIIRIRVG